MCLPKANDTDLFLSAFFTLFHILFDFRVKAWGGELWLNPGTPRLMSCHLGHVSQQG